MSARVLAFPTSRTSARPRRVRVRSRSSPSHDLLTRGVWKSPFLTDGAEVLIAVDSTGHRVVEMSLAGNRDEATCTAALQQLLATIDPPIAQAPLELLQEASERCDA